MSREPNSASTSGRCEAAPALHNPHCNQDVLHLLMNSLPNDWTERKRECQARLQYADIRPFLKDAS